MGWVFQFAMSVICAPIFPFFTKFPNPKSLPPSYPICSISRLLLVPHRRAWISNIPLDLLSTLGGGLYLAALVLYSNPWDSQWTPCAGVRCLQVTNQTYIDIMTWVKIVRNVTIPLYQTYTSYKQPSLKSYGCKKYFSSKLTMRVKIRSQNLNLSSALVWRESPGAEANEAAPNFSW